MSNLAQIVLSAIDKTGDAFSTVKASMRNVELQGTSLRDRLGDLGGLVSVGMFTAGVKAAIDYADKLADLSKITGISATTLDGLGYAAKTAGVDLDTVAKGVGKMQKALFDAAAGNKELSTVFGRLGIDARAGLKDTEGTLIKLAEQFASMPDGAEKSALAMKVFGKAGAELIPLLNEGGESLRNMIEEQRRWGGVSDETAARADAFNDTVEKLKMMSGALFREVASAVLPTLQALANMFVEAKEKGGGFKDVAEAVATGVKWMSAGLLTAKSLLEQVGNLLGGVGALVTAFFKGELFQNGGAIVEGIFEKNRELRGQLGADIAKVLEAVPAEVKPAAKKAGKNIAESIAAGVKDGFGSIMAGLDKQLAGSMSPYNKTVVETEIKLAEFERTTRKVTAAEREAAIHKAFLVDKLKLQKEMLSQLAAAQQEYEDAHAADLVRGDQILKGLTDGNEALKVEIEMVGQSARARALRNVELERERALSNVLDGAQREKINREFDMKKVLIEQREVLTENASLWSQGADLVGGFAVAMTDSFGSAVDYAKKQLKSLLVEMVAIFAKKWFLEMGANMVGGSTGQALMGMAGQQGQGSMAGTALSMIGTNPYAAGAFVALAGGALGAGIARRLDLDRRGQNIARVGGALLGAIPGAILGAIFGGRNPENQNFRFMQGTGGEGLFGGIGVDGSYAFDLKALRGITGGMDARILRLLGGNESAGTSALAAYTAAGRRMDGQPAQFAFPQGDATAAEQIAKELFQSRYGTLFELIDKSFADQIKNFSGTSEELKAFIDSALVLFESVGGSGLKGLNVENLRLMAREGEALGDTMNRVAGDMQSLNSMFVDETDSYLAALRFVSEEFAAAGVTLPVSVDTFKLLRSEIDFSTESGRAMYEMLVRIAPAMQQIDAASRQMLDGFNASLSQIFGNGFTKTLIETQASGLVARFLGMTGLLPGTDPLAAFKGIGNMDAAGLQYIFGIVGDEAKGLLTQILQLYGQYINLQDKVNTNTGGLGNTIGNTVDLIAQAKANLQQYLSNSLLNQQLTPLTLEQQKNFALSEFERIRLAALGGNADAINQLGGARDTYLQLLRQLEGSSSFFNSEFFRTFDLTKTVAGGGPSWQTLMQSALPASGAHMASDQDIKALGDKFDQLTMALLQGDRAAIDRLVAAVDRNTEQLQRAPAMSGPMGAQS